MSAQDKQRLFNVPGRFCKGPTDLTLPYPHGGTALGYMSAVSYKPVVTYDFIVAEEKGEGVAEIIATEGMGSLSFTLRQWDKDTIAEVFPATTTNALGTEERIDFPGSYQEALAAAGIVLLFSPLDSRQPGILMSRAVPALEATVALNFNLSNELSIGCIFYLLEGSGGAVEVVKLGDMTPL